MASIVYGLSGQGFGHSARSKETIRHLIDSGHQVKILTYGQSLFMLKEFANLIYEIPGLVLIYDDNRLSYSKTILKNALKIMMQARRWQKIKKVFSDFNPDVVITDFEPLTARLAKTFKRPLISIDNQHQLTHSKIKITEKYKKDLLTDRLIIKSIIGKADYFLITSFFKTEIDQPNAFLFPPIIRREIAELTPTEGDYILIYDGSNLINILPALQQTDFKFIVVGPEKSMPTADLNGNIIYKKYSLEEWLKLLAGAKAVIGTAGLSLLSECVYLQKPYLAMPIERQIEQVINAEYLKRLGYGDFTYELTAQKITEFVSKLEFYKEKLKSAEGYGNDRMFKKLDEVLLKLVKA